MDRRLPLICLGAVLALSLFAGCAPDDDGVSVRSTKRTTGTVAASPTPGLKSANTVSGGIDTHGATTSALATQPPPSALPTWQPSPPPSLAPIAVAPTASSSSTPSPIATGITP